MSLDPRSPVKRDWAAPEIRQLLDDARAVRTPSPTSKARGWRRLEAEVEGGARPARSFSWLAVFMGGCATSGAAALALLLVFRSPAATRTIDLAEDGELQVSRASVVEVAPRRSVAGQSERRVLLKQGRLEARIRKQAPGQLLAVVTPHLQVIVVGTEFQVLADERASRVAVTEGRVRVESPEGGAVELGPGESISSDDERLAATIMMDVDDGAERVSSCRSMKSPAERRGCYERMTEAGGLAAQNALYAWGLLERAARNRGRAIALWRQYESRYPDGALAAEVKLALVATLLEERRYEEALVEAENYGERFAGGPRADEIALLKGRLLCVRMRQYEPALRAFAQAREAALSQALRGETLFALGECQASVGRLGEARTSWSGYLEQYPEGPRASEARRRMREVR